MQVDGGQVGWKFWRRWALASSSGWFAGFLVGFVAASAFEPVLGIGPLQGTHAYFMLGVCLGAGVGLAQWLVLRRRISGTGWWVAASAGGTGIAGGAGYGAAVLLFGYSEGLEELGSFAAVLGWTVVAAFGGAVAGIFQWRLVRRQVSRAEWWVLASTAGWGLGMAVAGAVMVVGFHAMSDPKPVLYGALLFLGGLVAGGIVLGAFTGAAIVWLLTQPMPEAS